MPQIVFQLYTNLIFLQPFLNIFSQLFRLYAEGSLSFSFAKRNILHASTMYARGELETASRDKRGRKSEKKQ